MAHTDESLRPPNRNILSPTSGAKSSRNLVSDNKERRIRARPPLPGLDSVQSSVFALKNFKEVLVDPNVSVGYEPRDSGVVLPHS